jgi:hypothetical protein
MSEYGRFYEESLYPLQDGVLRRLASIHSPFYLTGGTALGRELIGHRYSDDLDFFLNDHISFRELVQESIAAIIGDSAGLGATLETGSTLFDERYSRITVRSGKVSLKIDFVNDIAFRVGDPKPGTLYTRIDSFENILSNKISALYRYESKDIADIWAIAKNYPFSWEETIAAAKKKDPGVSASDAAEIILGFPPELFDKIKWKTRPRPEDFAEDLRAIARDILESGPNSRFVGQGKAGL